MGPPDADRPAQPGQARLDVGAVGDQEGDLASPSRHQPDAPVGPPGLVGRRPDYHRPERPVEVDTQGARPGLAAPVDRYAVEQAAGQLGGAGLGGAPVRRGQPVQRLQEPPVLGAGMGAEDGGADAVEEVVDLAGVAGSRQQLVGEHQRLAGAAGPLVDGPRTPEQHAPGQGGRVAGQHARQESGVEEVEVVEAEDRGRAPLHEPVAQDLVLEERAGAFADSAVVTVVAVVVAVVAAGPVLAEEPAELARRPDPPVAVGDIAAQQRVPPAIRLVGPEPAVGQVGGGRQHGELVGTTPPLRVEAVGHRRHIVVVGDAETLVALGVPGAEEGREDGVALRRAAVEDADVIAAVERDAGQARVDHARLPSEYSEFML